MNSEYGEWESVKSQFSHFSFENESDLQIIYLTSLISRTSFYYKLLPSFSRIV